MLVAELFPYANVAYDILTVLYVLTIATVVGVILSENRNPVKSLAWVTVLALLPVMGLVLYLFFGRNLKGIRLVSRQDQRLLRSRTHFQHANVAELPLSDESKQMIRLTDTLMPPHFFTHTKTEIFSSGHDKFKALKRDLLAAEQYINLQYYIIENDHTGRELCNILVEKVKQGVKVRMLYDHVGSFTIHASFFKRLRKAGIDAHPFLEVTFTQLANRLNWRNHRKIVVIDGKVGYIGGMNIADRYVKGERTQKPWRDTHLRLEGDAVAALQYSFAIDWNVTSREVLPEVIPAFDQPPTMQGGLQVVSSSPTDRWNRISVVFLKAISLAQKSIYIQTPYFLPNDALLKALQCAALAHVDVRLMLPRRPDSLLLRYASNSYLKECMLSGIKVYFYESAMLHAKTVIMDDEFVTTGSTNFDFRSFEHNLECNVMVYDPHFCQQMKDLFLADQEQSTRVTLAQWKKRSVWQKALESMVRLMSPIL